MTGLQVDRKDTLQSILVVTTEPPACPYAADLLALASRHAPQARLLAADELAQLASSNTLQAEPAVVLFAPTLDRPLPLARSLRRQWQRCELLFVREPGDVAEFRRQLGLAPLLGLHWSVLACDPALEDAVARASQAARRRTRLRTTLDQANVSLQPPVQTTEDARRRLLADRFLASFVDVAEEAIVALDIDGQVVLWSASAEELFEQSAATAIGQDVRALRFWDAELDRALHSLTTGGRSQLVEHTLLRDGQPIALEIHCSAVRDETQALIGVSLMIRDVSALAAQRAAHEAQLQAERSYMHRLFQQAPGFVAVTQGPKHLLTLANRAFYQLVGHRKLIGRPAAEAFPEMEGRPVRELLDWVYASRRAFVGRGVAVSIQRAASAPPEVRYVDFVFQPVLTEHGLVSGIFCQGNDVTAQRQAQEQLRLSEEHLQSLVEERTRELEQSRQALHQSQKLEAIGKLTGGVAHDFNNVLQIIGANLHMVRAAVAQDAQLTARLDLANSAVERGAKLSSQLLAFARRQPLSPAPTDLTRLLRDMDGLLRRALGEHIEIETVVAGGLWTTLVDPNQLENVVLNLAINARDAMRDGGRLTLELSNAMLDEDYAAAAGDVKPGQYVQLAVSDTGCGMPPEVVEQVFEPFYTTKPEGEGTGLGLSMAYGFLKQSGGHIRVYSEPGHGTTVKLYLPRTLQSEVRPAPPLRGPIVGGHETILVVEDDLAVQATVVDQLKSLGYSVLHANDAQSAMSILQSGLVVDVLFTDVVMPGPLRSPELARRAQQLLPDIVVLFTSGYTQNAIVHGGRLDPGVELISKPYRLEQLSRKLRHLLANREQRRVEAQQAPALAAPDARLRVLVVDDDPTILEVACEMLDALGHAAAGAASAEDALELLGTKPFDAMLTDISLPGLSGQELVQRAREQQPGVQVAYVSGYGAQVSEPGIPVLPKPYTLPQLEALLATLAR